MLVTLAVATFRDITFVVDRFEVPVTFRVPPRTEEAFMVMTLAVERLEIPT